MRFTSFSLLIPEDSRVQDLLPTIGIPLQAVDLILINSSSVDSLYRPENNDRISLYPVFETFDISSITKVRDHPLRRPRFAADVHLGRLARYLRLLGFDTFYRNLYSPSELLSLSVAEERTLLSKSESLLQSDTLTKAFLITSADPRRQLMEVLDRFDLYGLMTPFTRCVACNTLLRRADKQSILSRIPASVKSWCNEYQWCASCDRIYWKGSHYARMQELILEIIREHRNRSDSGARAYHPEM